MASAWPIIGQPRQPDLDYRTDSVPTTRTLIQTGAITLLGISAPNNTAGDVDITLTDGNNKLVWIDTMQAKKTGRLAGDLEPCTDLYMQASVAGVPLHVWGWKTT